MSVTRFSHVTLVCSDLDASLEFYRDGLEMSISDRKLPPGFPRAVIGCFVDGQWCLHFFQATAEQRAQFEALSEPRTGPLMHVSLRAEGLHRDQGAAGGQRRQASRVHHRRAASGAVSGP